MGKTPKPNPKHLKPRRAADETVTGYRMPLGRRLRNLLSASEKDKAKPPEGKGK